MLKFCSTNQLILRGFNAADGVLVDAVELGDVLWGKIQNLHKDGLLMVLVSVGSLHCIRATEAGIIFSQSYHKE
jgi:hypothetical protein